MNAAEARRMIDAQDVENSEEVQNVYKAIKAEIASKKPGPGDKVEFTRSGGLSGAAKAHLERQGYTITVWGDWRDGDYYSVKF